MFAAVPLLVGLAVIAGWLLDIRILVKPVLHLRGMPFNAAICFTLVGSGLLASAFGYRRSARAAAGLTFVLAGLTLAQDLTGRSFGIDELFVRSWLRTPWGPRMAGNAAVGCLIASAGIWLTTRSRHTSLTGLVTALLASVIVAIALATAVGFFTGLTRAYAWGTFSPIAPHAAVALAFIGLAVFSASWKASQEDGEAVPSWVAAPATVTSGLTVFVLWNALRADDAVHTEALHAAVSGVVVLFGLVICGALGVAIHYWQKAANHQASLQAANEALAQRIAEARRLTEALAERERLLEAVLESLPVGVFIARSDGTIERANRAGTEIWAGVKTVGLDEYHEYRGWWADTGEPVTEWALARAIRTGETSLNEMIEIEAFDGTRKTILNSAVPVLDDTGQLRAAVVAIQDITARRRTELALDLRTRELERSNRELQEFAYVASHDLQEPLRMVSSYVQLLARRYEGRLDANADEFIGFAVDGARRMQSLLNDLLMYSRSGSPEERFEAVALDAAVRAARENLQASIEECVATFDVGPLPHLTGSATQLTQLFQNLIGNAIKFRSAAAPRISIAARRSNGEWEIRVSDNGIGIDPQYAERIFVIFQRLHQRQEYPGTGIGLAICKKIVTKHGGRIWCEPRPEGGSTFIFTLPAVRASGVSPGEAA